MSNLVAGNSIPFLCNQEREKNLKANSYKINNALQGFYKIINPAVKNNFD